ncbi:MAG: hypothetical protein JRE23_00685 [Deltaproteobacteria bacterium]|nr:hypothetical protein [Deltaproteobacteria bacterium]
MKKKESEELLKPAEMREKQNHFEEFWAQPGSQCLGKTLRFTDEELDFIINYDIKYRTPIFTDG